jgi:hypothetical protein
MYQRQIFRVRADRPLGNTEESADQRIGNGRLMFFSQDSARMPALLLEGATGHETLILGKDHDKLLADCVWDDQDAGV